jgi:acetyl esterase/lipase
MLGRIFAVLFGFGLALSWSTPTLAQHASPTVVMRGVEYARAAGKPLRLDLYLPDSTGGPWPVVVWFHGQPGRKYPTPVRYLTGFGYAVASVEYRASRIAPFPAQLRDAKAAVRWLRTNALRYRIDPDRIGAWGESAGGHLAVMLATTAGVPGLDSVQADAPSSRIQAAVNFFGPGRRGAASPFRYLSADDAPVFIAHGTADRTVSSGRSELLYSALRSAGVEATLEMVRGARHDFAQVHTTRVDSLVRSFLDRHLQRAGTPAPAR